VSSILKTQQKISTEKIQPRIQIRLFSGFGSAEDNYRKKLQRLNKNEGEEAAIVVEAGWEIVHTSVVER